MYEVGVPRVLGSFRYRDDYHFITDIIHGEVYILFYNDRTQKSQIRWLPVLNGLIELG